MNVTADESTVKRVLIVDDEANLRSSLSEYLTMDGFECAEAAEGAAALNLLSERVFDAVVLDLRMSGMDGMTLLGRMNEGGITVPAVMMSAHGEIRDAVDAMKLGAVDYLVKPFDPAELVLRLEKAIAGNRLRLLAEAGLRLSQHSLLGEDPAMDHVRFLIGKAAPTGSTVLITGESGTGKEVMAREIHRQSRRAEGPFVAVNVGAIPETLLESELFGFEKGSFTGAHARKAGLFELANGGTLFLDEAGEMPPMMQVKLLRVLQERCIQRLGGVVPIPVDVRILAATNRDLEAAVRDGSFREDLYFRLNVIHLHVPPLRERPRDIPILAGRFAARFAAETGKTVRGISPSALELLAAYPFPGNVRELENAVERAVILGEGDVLEPSDFMLGTALHVHEYRKTEPSPQDSSLPEIELLRLSDLESAAIRKALLRNGGHREHTAAELGISRRTLLNKMREYGIPLS